MQRTQTQPARSIAGFTLVELLVVVTILGLLAIIAVPQLFRTREKGVRKEGMTNVMNIAGPLVLFAKMMLVGFLIFWVRFTFPRFREDQLQAFAWKYLIPISLVNIMATMILKVAF